MSNQTEFDWAKNARDIDDKLVREIGRLQKKRMLFHLRDIVLPCLNTVKASFSKKTIEALVAELESKPLYDPTLDLWESDKDGVLAFRIADIDALLTFIANNETPMYLALDTLKRLGREMSDNLASIRGEGADTWVSDF